MSKKRNNKYFIATLAGTIVASSVVSTPNLTEAAGKTFPDVKADDYFADAVADLVDRGLVKGFPDGNFKPYNSLTRGQAAVILAGALKLDTKNVKNPNFKDVSTVHPYYGAIATLANAGYINGFEDGTYGSGKPITRNHMAIILTKAFDLKASSEAVTPFTDIYPDYKQYITALFENGITVGNTKTTFGGSTNVTRGQFAQFLLRAENAAKAVSFTIEDLSNSSLQTTEGKLTFDAVLKSIFSTKNAAALKGAEMTATVQNGKITGITALTLNAEGKAGASVVFDGGNTTIAGDVTVNGDYIAVNNLKVKGDLILTNKVSKDFSSNGLVTDGQLIISDAASSPVAALFSFVANTNEGPKVILTNSSVKGVQVERNNVQLTSDKKIPEVKVSAKVSTVEVNADVEKVTIDVTVKLEIKGTGSIDQVEVEKAVELALKLAGQVKELVIANKGTKVEVGVNVQIDRLVVPKNSKVEDVVSNYSSIKDKIKDIKDESGATVTPQPPSSGGSTGGNNSAQIKQALINTANQKIAAIPAVDAITGENKATVKAAIEAAQLAISAAKNAGARDTDFVGLAKVQAALDKIQEIDSKYELSIMHTNDTHGRTDVAPKRATAVKQVRAEKTNSLLIDAGDVFSGTLFFNEFKGEADLKLMNYIGYDVMTFGNHEFDLGSSPEGHQALADFVKGAEFSFVSSNVDFTPDEKFTGLFSDLISSEPENGKIYNGIVKEINGEKVGIFGLTTEETKGISSPGSIAFKNYIAEAEKAVKAFEDMDVDKIIAVTHIGYDDNAAIDNDLILAQSVPGIDVIVGGHSHTQLDDAVVIDKNLAGEEKDPTVIVQAFQYSDFLGTLDVTFDENGIVKEYENELLEVSKFEEDAEAVEILKPYKEKVQELNETEIGVTLTEPLTNPRAEASNPEGLSVRKNETILGDLITDGMLSKAKEYDENVVMAFTNGGGIRSSINAGPITIGEVISVLPFGNTLALMDVTGAELKAAFELSISQYPNELGGFLHVAGAKIEFDSSKPARAVKDGVVTEEGQRIISISYKNADGSYTEIKEGETFTVATNAFTAKGGDNYDMLGEAYKKGRVTDLGLSDWENFRDHLQSLETMPTEIEGRIVDVKETEPVPEQESDLIISQYIEGGSYNKALELYNNSNETLDLTQYSLELYSDGKADNPKSLTLTGTLEAGKTLILYHNQASDEIKTLAGVGGIGNSTVINHNGNDPFVLKKNGEIIDSIGQIGSSADFAKDVTLVRKESIISGDKNPNDAFSFETEWINLGKDVFDNLGAHPYIPEQLETISMADARALGTGEVQIQGVVTGKLKNTIHFQDETGAIALYGLAENVNVGDEIVVKGKLTEYNGLLQLQSPALVESVGSKEVAPIEYTGADLKEENESKLAIVKNVKIIKDNGSGNFVAEDEAGTSFIVRDENTVLGLEAGKTYNLITGIIQEYNGAFQIIPRGVEDVVEDASKVRSVVASTTSTSIPTGTEVKLTTLTEGAKIYYTTDGSEPTVDKGTEYTAPIVIEEKTTLKAIAVKDGFSNSDTFTITYDVYDGNLSISDIQGLGHTSPMNGMAVEGIEGIITSMYELNGQQYFHMQTPDSEVDNDPNTSEGIVVFAGSAATSYPFKVGNLVSITGVVDEYRIDGYADAYTDLTVTELNATKGSIKIIEENAELPKPIIITSDDIPAEIDTNGFDTYTPATDAIDYWESLEGMRVQIGADTASKLRVVSPEEYGEIITVFDEVKATTLNGGLLLGENDANAERIQFKLFNGEKEVSNGGNINTGDSVDAPVIGFVNYGYSNFKVYVDQSSFKTTAGNIQKETTSIVEADGKLTIASYNLENFSANSNATKVRNIAEAFVNGLNSPDIIGVTEMQDNDGATASGSSAADESYQKLIDAIIAADGPTYKYVNIDPEYNQDGGAPGGNIRVGFLYNPEKVSLPTESDPGTANQATAYEDGQLTLNPGRIDPTSSAFNSSRKPLAAEFTFNGEQVIVIVNHWNSKGGDSPLFGTQQPAVLGSEAQRKDIAQVVRGFVETIQTANPNANIVAVGDFNDFQWTPALQIFEGENESMFNMINTLNENDRYSYTYQGNSQALDHIFVSDNLRAKSILDILHVNADFTEEAGRASDHDPLMVQIDFTK